MTISKRLYANNAKTYLAADITSYVTSIEVVDGSLFPTPNVGEYFFITIELGPKIEIIRVNSRTGNFLNGCERGQEGKTAWAFTAGARVENRVTADSLVRFENVVDTLSPIASIDLLDLPMNSNSTTYISAAPDSSGNPIIAIRQTDTKWRFSTHSIVSVQGTVSAGGGGSKLDLGYTTSLGLLNSLVDGKYIIQFNSGNNTGQVRRLTGSGVNTISWSTALPFDCVPGDLFDIYISDANILADIADSTNNSLLAALGNRAKHGYIYFIGNF